MRRKSTICWNCMRNAGQCSWSAWFLPVPGWKAIYREYKDSGGVLVFSYCVRHCPLFLKSRSKKTWKADLKSANLSDT